MVSEVLERLRNATPAELEAVAMYLDVDLGPEAEVNLVRLADAFEGAGSADYRRMLLSVGSRVAAEAKWKKMPRVDTSTKTEWIEDYIYQGCIFIQRDDRASLSRSERVSCQERAHLALGGRIASAKEESDKQLMVLTAAVGVGIGLLFWEVMLAGAAVVAAATLIRNLFGGPSMKTLAPAAFVLIHIRKRLEYEDVLRLAESEAA